MAVAARPQAVGGSTGLKVALVVFVVLTVASLAFAIILYTQHEGLAEERNGALRNADTAQQQQTQAREQLASFLRTLDIDADAGNPAAVQAALDGLAANFVGKDPARMTEQQRALAERAKLNPDDSAMTTFQKIHQFAVTQLAEYDKLVAEHKAMTDELARKTSALKETEDRYNETAKKLQDQFVEAEQKNQANQEAWNQELERVRQQAETEAGRASEQLAAERKQREALAAELTQQKSRIDELIATLAAFRPSPNEMSLLQIRDGDVVQTVSGQPIVYISLGRRNHIQPGMTFAVYSRVRGIPPSGKGKATIRVTNVFETTSECEVTTADATDPIVEGDAIANPVYDATRKYNFVVAGDFDLNFDGRIDDPNGEQVKKLIKEWGGDVVERVDTRTDFVVLGTAPPLPVARAGEAAEAATAATTADQLAAQRTAAREAFDEAKNEARTLSIPVLTRTQFLHFVGFGVPESYKDDQPPI